MRNVPLLTTIHFQNCQFFQDRRFMLELVPKNGVGAELGVFKGDFSKILLSDLTPRKLILIDTTFSADMSAMFASEISAGVVEVIHGDSSTKLAGFPANTFDWIYIDGDHSLEGVTRDAYVALEKLRSGGLLLFNDYKMGDHNCPGGFYEYGVIHVVNDLCTNKGLEMIGFAFHPQMYCDVALKRRAE